MFFFRLKSVFKYFTKIQLSAFRWNQNKKPIFKIFIAKDHQERELYHKV